VFICLVVAQCLYSSPCAADDDGYLAKLLERARRERLAERPEWQALLHYQPRHLSHKVISQVDEPTFFLASQGKYQPQDELDATLESFFRPAGADPDRSPQCLYVARYHWLDQVLGFDRERLPEVPCRRFEKWREEMHPGRITLVFPAAYLNNPASMFGHTLLRVDRPGDEAKTPLLAYTINYAADTRQQKGFEYAFKGLFGDYRGRFSIAPYYAAVKTYGDIENRDIWEFGLSLKPEEIDQLLRHLWEMRSAWFDYYFLDENCSYHLLSLLDTARPGLDLAGRFPRWVIPSETVRAVADAGLVEEVRFRPARNTILQERLLRMDARLQDSAKRLSLGGLSTGSAQLHSLPEVQQAQVIDLALDYTLYRQSPKFGAQEPNTGRVSELLLARSRLAVPDQTPAIPAPKVWPGAGHQPARARIGYGFEDRRQFIEVAGGPAYHDIMDPQGGFTRGARVNLLQGELRYYPEEGKAELERFDIIDIMSMSSWNRFLHPVSWKATLGVTRKHPGVSDSQLLGKFDAGVGISHDFSRETSAYAFAEGNLEWSDRFRFFAAPGVGPRVGLVHDFSQRWRGGLSFVWQLFFLHEVRNDYEALVENRFTLNGQNVAGLDIEWRRDFGNAFPGLKLYWQHYF